MFLHHFHSHNYCIAKYNKSTLFSLIRCFEPLFVAPSPRIKLYASSFKPSASSLDHSSWALIIQAQIWHILDHQHSIAIQVLHSLIKLFFQVECFLSWSPRSPWLLKHLTLHWLQPLLILMFSTNLISLLQSCSKLAQMLCPSSLTASQTTFSSSWIKPGTGPLSLIGSTSWAFLAKVI